MWPQFDALAAQASSADMNLLIEAIKMQTELMNIRLGATERLGAAQLRLAGSAAMQAPGARR